MFYITDIGDDKQSTLLIQNDNSACNLSSCPCFGVRYHLLEAAAGGG